MDTAKNIEVARKNLVETGGRTSQELGLGRIVGQVLVHLYLQPNECSLDVLEQELGLSKASVSVAARQLEALGLIQRVWIKGERKKYYRSAENIASALQQGLLAMFRHKVQHFGGELEKSMNLLEFEPVSAVEQEEFSFIRQRIQRAKKLQERLSSILGNPLVRLLAKMNNS
ncbi:DNA-binding transcriptional regulator GbsR, MarR family [Candidatus Electrothrix aarhusensis]|uniref:DNA-binding transcriptional regulator GbsR, MarR family n=1 Tax=Candidatus Electrothrix aarhusensis TaxID=1859131 RepID=A0A3S3UC68_9BACT|nr:DNA-binding transcriptional regulator GbsR, MarR family [Candidatus Electrothrix aarhusensis]